MKLKFDFNECLKQGLLRRIPRSKQKAENSVETAYKWLDEAEKNFASSAFNSCLLSCYLAMFHSARAILYKDGFREKSHACIARYLEGIYVKKGLLEQRFVDLLDHHRELRHQDQYGVNFFAIKEDCEQALESAKIFLSEMDKIFNK